MCTNAASRARDDDPPLRLWRWRDTSRTRSAIFRLSSRPSLFINLKTAKELGRFIKGDRAIDPNYRT